MKPIFYLYILFFSSLISAAPVKNVIYSEEAAERPAVASTGAFTEISVSDSGRKNTGRNTAAARLTQKNKKFFWTPSQIRTKATGGADLINAVLSKDESLLIIAERIGGTNQNNSTRLIFFDLQEKKICGGHLLEERRISDILLLPGSEQLLAVQNAQEEFDHKDSVLKIDLKSGKITAVSPPAPGRINSLCSNGQKVWYTVENTKKIFELSLARLTDLPRIISTQTGDPRAVLTPDFSRLIVYGKNQIEWYSILKNKQTGLADISAVSEKYEPAEALVLNNAGTFILLNEPEKEALFFQNSIIRTAAEKTTSLAAAAFFPRHNKLLLSVMKQNALLFISLPDGKTEGKPIQPGKLKPLSRNSNWKLLPLSGSAVKALLIDHRGNIMLLEKTKRRWKKHELLTVDKTGFR